MDTIFDEHLQSGPVGVEINRLVEHASLEYFVSGDAAEAITIPVHCGSYRCISAVLAMALADDRLVDEGGISVVSRTTVAAEAVGNGLATVRCDLYLLGLTLRDDKAVTRYNDVEAIHRAGVVPAVIAVAESLKLSFSPCKLRLLLLESYDVPFSSVCRRTERGSCRRGIVRRAFCLMDNKMISLGFAWRKL